MKRVVVLLLVGVSLVWLPSAALSADKEQPTGAKTEQTTALKAAQQGKEQKTEQADPLKRVLVKVGNVSITQREFDLQFNAAMDKFAPDKRSMFMNPHGRRQFLDMLVDQKVWLNWALAESLYKDPDVALLADMSRDQILIRRAYDKIVAKATPTDSEVRRFYDENRTKFLGPVKARVSHIVLADSTEARRVLAQLKAGADFAKLAKEKSRDAKTADLGGDLGFLTQGSALPASVGGSQALETAIFSIKSGGLSDVIKAGNDYQIIRIESRTEPEILPFDTVKQRIVDAFTNEKVNTIRTQLFQQLKTKYPAEYMIEDSSLGASKSMLPPGVADTPEELFQAATDAKDSSQRIGIYQELLKKFPESKYAAQAQFMVGFIYSEELKNYDEAELAFKAVMKKYPASDLVDSAMWMIKNMRGGSQKVGTVEDVKRKAKGSQVSGK